jgi:hypothetical protein
MAITDAAGLPIAVWTAGANRHEVKLVEDTLSVFVVDETPKRLIADRAYDSVIRCAKNFRKKALS